MTRYETLANDLSNMLHEQLRICENKFLLSKSADDIFDNSYEYVVKSNLVSTVDNMLDSQQLDEDEIIALMGKSLEDLCDFYHEGFDEDVNEIYCDCIIDFCLEAKED